MLAGIPVICCMTYGKQKRQWCEQVERAPFRLIHDTFPFQDRDDGGG